MRGTRLSLSEYTRAVDAGWRDDDIGRAIIHDLPRRFHALSPAAQRRVLSEAPPLTNTRWDALLAATAEHIAGLHGHPVPDWVDEAPRARIDSAHAAVTEAVREIARERQLPGSWLNEQATSFLPRRPDTAAPTLYDCPSLVVTGASPRYLLAMKLRSARGHDEKDVATLIRYLDIGTVEEAVSIHDHLFPDTPLTARGHDLLMRIFRPRAEPSPAPDGNV